MITERVFEYLIDTVSQCHRAVASAVSFNTWDGFLIRTFDSVITGPVCITDAGKTPIDTDL